MNENVNNFINSVQKQDYTTAKDEFQSAMADKINSAFENKKIEIAGQMSSSVKESVAVEEETETLDEKKKTRQMMDPKTETMVVKDGKVEVIDKKDVDKYMKKGYEMAEETEHLDEGKIRNMLFKMLNRKKDKKDFNPFHWQSAKDMVSKHLGSGSKEGKEILDKHNKLASGSKYAEMSDKAAKQALADNMETLADDINAAKKKQK